MTHFLKALALGNLLLVAVWVTTVGVFWWRSQIELKNRGIHGLTAMAGGWHYLLLRPLIIILLALAFGCGLILSSK